MQAVSYEFYESEYFGDLIPRPSWYRWESRAFTKVMHNTFGNEDDSAILKKCICAVAEYLYQQDQIARMSLGIKSESTDGHSVTFDKANASQQAQSISHICLEYLADTGLMYPGVHKC